ncbi:GNAT family N-acetyltransferase [Paenibacillus aestuarii]|uniref:GNAT family N-acetyltransferase n=1 Tax=Paenibacillus aestuarii TaxID=516965 RepID=A0ABW0K4J4_9BACL|nr:GNAT family N-acetyltransferase [Paenibacillus aestuarii]
MGRYRDEARLARKVQAQTVWVREDGFTVHIDKRFLDLEVIFQFLTQESYWAKEIQRELVEAAVEHSTLCFGIFHGDPSKGPAEQVGFARVVSDLVRFAWLGDVFVLPQYRGLGLSKWLMSIIVNHPQLKGTSFNLGTRDAHSLYAQYGFKPLTQVENRMSRAMNWQDIYEGYGLKE